MKKLLLAASLVANLALVAAFALHPAYLPPSVGDYFWPRLDGHTTAIPPAAAKAAVAPADAPITWSVLDTKGDLRSLVSRLRAAGYPANIVRAVLNAQLSNLYDARIRALSEMDPSTPFWKLRAPYYSSGDARMVEMERLYRERAKLSRELLADPFFATDQDLTAGQRARFGNLSQQKIEQLQRIEDDYAEMTAAVRAGMGGITLPEDRDKLALLAREKKADLATVLTPEELADYELRTSQTTSRLRSGLANFDPSEAEFRAIYQAQTALNGKFPAGISSIDSGQRRAAQTEFYDQIHAALGDARYGDYVRELDRDFQQLSRMAAQNSVSRDTAIRAFNLRDSLAAESNRIFDDPALSVDQKRTALQLLAQGTRTQLLATLGPTVGPAYVKIADQWLSNVERGSAVDFKTALPLLVINDQGTSGTMLGGTSYRRLPSPPPSPRP